MFDLLKSKLVLVILVALGLSISLNGLQHFSNVALGAKLAAEKVNVTTAQNNEEAAKKSLADWQAQAERLQKENRAIITKQDEFAAANATALAAAEAKQRQADAAVTLWRARYSQIKNAKCTAILNAPLTICPELVK